MANASYGTAAVVTPPTIQIIPLDSPGPTLETQRGQNWAANSRIDAPTKSHCAHRGRDFAAWSSDFSIECKLLPKLPIASLSQDFIVATLCFGLLRASCRASPLAYRALRRCVKHGAAGDYLLHGLKNSTFRLPRFFGQRYDSGQSPPAGSGEGSRPLAARPARPALRTATTARHMGRPGLPPTGPSLGDATAFQETPALDLPPQCGPRVSHPALATLTSARAWRNIPRPAPTSPPPPGVGSPGSACACRGRRHPAGYRRGVGTDTVGLGAARHLSGTCARRRRGRDIFRRRTPPGRLLPLRGSEPRGPACATVCAGLVPASCSQRRAPFSRRTTDSAEASAGRGGFGAAG